MNKVIYQDEPLYPKILWQRPVHKYNATAGKVMIFAGSKNMTGAAMLACEAVFRSGTGVLLLGFPTSLKATFGGILTEAMMLELPETPGHTLSKKADEVALEHANSCDVTIIGPGLSENAETIQLIWELTFGIKKSVVLCEDGVSAFTKGIVVMRSRGNEEFMTDYLRTKHGELVLVLTQGEAIKLAAVLKIDKEYLPKGNAAKLVELISILAEKLACTIVLAARNPQITTNTGVTIISRLKGPEHATDNSTGVMASIIGSFMAQNPEKHIEAIATATYLHGLAAKIAIEEHGKIDISSSDILRYLPKAIKKAEE